MQKRRNLSMRKMRDICYIQQLQIDGLLQKGRNSNMCKRYDIEIYVFLK